MEELERLTTEVQELGSLVVSLRNQIRVLVFDKLDIKRFIKLNQPTLKTLKVSNFVTGKCEVHVTQ